jgi:hypothetical protein
LTDKSLGEIMQSKVSLNANLKLDDWLFSPKEIRQLVKEFLEQFREDTVDEAQMQWNEGLDQIIEAVDK